MPVSTFCKNFCTVCLLGLILLFSCLTVPSSTLAQTELAGVYGRVTDPSGAVIVDAEVEMKNVETGISTTVKTNQDGLYTIPSLHPGHYLINVRKPGFKSVTVTELTLNVQDNVVRNFALQVGSIAETVTITADDLHINTTDATVSTVVDRQFAENLPLNGRSFQTLIELTPGVVLTAGAGQFSVNGQRAASNYWMVDGVGANIGISAQAFPGNGLGGSIGSFNVLGGTNSLVSIDAMEEFRIQTSTYAPEYGRSPGGQISIVTRSGTNQFHGSAFDYLRNDLLDANDWFADNKGLRKPPDRQNDFGGTLGGPILKDRTFFFFSYEGLRLRLPTVKLTAVPTVTARQNAIAAVQPFLNAFPRPNGPSSGADQAQYNASFSIQSSLDAYSIRVDHKLKDKIALFGRFNYSPSSSLQPGATGSLSNVGFTGITTKTATVGTTWSIAPAISNDFRVNYSRTQDETTNFLTNAGGAVPLTAAAIQSSNFVPSPYTTQNARGLFNISGVQGGSFFLGTNFLHSQQQINIVDGLSVLRSSHNLRFGVDFRRLSPVYAPQSYSQSDSFSGVPAAETGSVSFSQVSSSNGATILLNNVGAYAQDTWRIHRRLTMTYGLRWDVDFAPSTTSGPSLLAVTGLNLNNLSNLALAPAGTPPFKTTYGNVAPRLGVAYQLSQSQKWQTVFRGGFGTFFDLASQEIGNMLVATSYPFGAQTTKFGGTFPLSTSSAAPPSTTAASLSTGTLLASDPNLEQPYTLQWNVALEQALGNSQTLTASYIGASGRRLLARVNVSKPNPNFGFANLAVNRGTSDYDALQIQFQRRLSRGLQALASYTWAHSLDAGSAGTFSVRSVSNTTVDRGPSDFDIRNAFSAGVTYDIPSPKKNLLTKAMLGGWSVENLVLAQSASPVNVVDVLFTQLLGSNLSASIRPDLVPGQPLYLFGPQYPGGKALNAAAFAAPPLDPTTHLPARQGNLGRNALRGFGATQWDLAVHRDFPIHEFVHLQFRAEMFNVINHPNFGPPSNSFGFGGFGISSQTLGQSLAGSTLQGLGGFSPLYQIGGPRSIQFALKLTF